MDAAAVAGRWSGLPLLATHVGILIVCDVRLVRDGLAELLDAEAGLSAVAHAASGDEALAQLYRVPPPDIVLIDAALAQGPALVRRFRGIDPQVRCVPFGVDDALDTTSLWAEAGAVGFVRRSASLADLIGVLDGVMRNDRAGDCSPHPDVFLPMTAALPTQVPAPPRPVLTRRERQILEQIYAGRSNKEIARCLGIEPATVKCHVHNLLAKLNVHRRVQAAVWMREHAAELPCG